MVLEGGGEVVHCFGAGVVGGGWGFGCFRCSVWVVWWMRGLWMLRGGVDADCGYARFRWV